ncbi:calmodulin-binding transcription activator 2-like isoform X2 [Watersipora subatra]|uniref:calmodulin-binding transcription activator 2-like isoform X2 n=1 Tax=Watersipora subatra TaxID=2589382 RepID=UPI00355C712B
MTETLLPNILPNSIKSEVPAPVIAAELFQRRQYRWKSSEEIYAILTATSQHAAWLSHSTHIRPPNGSVILYDRDTEGLNYRRDGYVWKKRKDGKHAREDHMRLRVKGADLVNGYYTHSAILSSFHRRSYNLPDRPSIMLVHYLNAPAEGQEPPMPSLRHCDKRVWDRTELAEQIYPMYDMSTDLMTGCQNLSLASPPSPATINKIIDNLLASQTSEDGVQVTAQWVLSLGNNGSYLVQAPQNPTFQIPSNNVQLLLAPISTPPVIQRVQQTSSVGLVNLSTQAPIATADQYMCEALATQPTQPSQTAASQPITSIGSSQVYLPCLSSDAQTSSTIQPPLINVTNESQTGYILNSSTGQCSGAGNSSVFGMASLPRQVVTDTPSLHTPCQQNQHGASVNAVEAASIRDPQLLMDTTQQLTEDLPTSLDITDMTAEEISSTLAANMPNSFSPAHAGDLSEDLQLDSNFDLFAELNVNEELSQATLMPDAADKFDLLTGKVTLKALAPEWSYSNGGCKVLLVGPWRHGEDQDDSSGYTCLFGEKTVKADLVQDGVLSCITPAHEHGEVQVKVAYDGKVISESSKFEFRDQQSELSRYRSWFLCEESRLQMALLDRLELIKCRLDVLFPAPISRDQMNLEQMVIALLHAVKRYKWRSKESLPKPSYKGLTLFHLAAALGYRSLLELLKCWREESSCELLDGEVSTRTKDNGGCIALHWACALGRMETALVMYYMDRMSLDEVNNDGMTPLSLARAFKNQHIVEMLLQEEQVVLESKLDSQGLNNFSPMPSPSKHTLRRSVSPVRRVSPVRHPPITRHNSTPNAVHPSYLVPHHEAGAFCMAPEQQPRDLDDEDTFVDVEALSDNENSSTTEPERDNSRIRTLAEHIIAAIPDRIKTSASDDSSSVALMSYRERSSSRSSYSSTPSCAEDSGVCTPLTGDWVEEWNRRRLSASPCFSADSIYKPVTSGHSPGLHPYYHQAAGISQRATSAASSTSYNTGRSDSPPPSAQILGEYFNAGEGVEYGLSQLTLSDTEQRKLYQAAQVIQHAFRQFKDKKQQQREIEAAVIIQTYYRRFKEFTTLRHIQKQQAATRIQSQFRSYYAQKRFKRSRDAALLIQHHYRAYKEHEQFKRSRNAAVLIQQKFRTHYNRKKCSKQLNQDVR